MLYDIFICHASEDKDSFVRPLAKTLQASHVEVWFDEFSLQLGDSIRRSIDKGLRQSRFGIVVLSPAFFEKNWPQYELDGLVEREMRGNDKIILPLWHGVTHDHVMQYSPALAGQKAASSQRGIREVVNEILEVIRPQGSPLIVARDMLLEWGITPPVITDQYWLEVVEASNRVPGFGPVIPEDSGWNRWSFPLPAKDSGATEWGERLAWTAMQMNWVKTADKAPITPLTPPTEVLDFILGHPGLFETCCDCVTLLVEYAPQLSIPGFGGDLEDAIEQEYQESCAEAEKRQRQDSRFGSALTINNKTPLCDEEWALRHPTFGNYEPVNVTNAYFHGGMFGPSVSPYSDTDHAFWLLSSASSWLPKKIHSFLLEGMKSWHVWLWGDWGMDKGGDWKSNGTLSRALHEGAEGKAFKWTRPIKDDVLHRAQLAINTLKLSDPPEHITELFIAHDFPQEWIKDAMKRRKAQSSGKGKGRRNRETDTVPENPR
jgi:hypothetical protein